jgi:hypothetical protein
MKGGENMRKVWKKPLLEVLDISKTMSGGYSGNIDMYDPCGNPEHHHHS